MKIVIQGTFGRSPTNCRNMLPLHTIYNFHAQPFKSGKLETGHPDPCQNANSDNSSTRSNVLFTSRVHNYQHRVLTQKFNLISISLSAPNPAVTQHLQASWNCLLNPNCRRQLQLHFSLWEHCSHNSCSATFAKSRPR